MSNPKKTPAQAHYGQKAITPVMVEFIKYLEAETGYKVDPISVQLASLLRGRFQKSPANQTRLAEKAAAVETARKSRSERAAVSHKAAK
ncbi:MAG: hypothetical protein ACOH19_03160 [Rhodoglobus sp.]